MRVKEPLGRRGPAGARLLVAAALGTGAGVAMSVFQTRYAPVVGWIASAAAYLVWTWAVIARMDPGATATHATREDPTRPFADLVLLVASIASLGGVGYLLMAGSSQGTDTEIAAVAGFASVVAAWSVVHTVFTLRYAMLYYQTPAGGVSFNQNEPPAYVDFAYLAFTLGMTYQVSDTDLQTRDIRATALRHALLSFLLGAVILAATINLIAGLGHSS
jgi:uncharacterized membrane protein